MKIRLDSLRGIDVGVPGVSMHTQQAFDSERVEIKATLTTYAVGYVGAIEFRSALEKGESALCDLMLQRCRELTRMLFDEAERNRPDWTK